MSNSAQTITKAQNQTMDPKAVLLFVRQLWYKV